MKETIQTNNTMTTETNLRTVTVNEEQRLYLIPYASGYSCLGFDVCEERIKAMEIENGYTIEPASIGTLERYAQLEYFVDIARQRFESSGTRSQTDLIPELIGKEGKRVEVVDCYGETRRFKVGKSTGFIPCHIELTNSRSRGGRAVMGTPFKSIRIIS